MDFDVALEKFKRMQKTLQAYNHAQGMLYYDSVTGAPKGTQRGLADTMEVLGEVTYNLSVNDEVFEMLDALQARADELDPVTRKEVEERARGVKKLRKVPIDEYLEAERLSSDAQFAWHEAKEKSDYETFKPCLAKLIETTKRFSGYTDPGVPVYNALLDQYERGLTTDELDAFFALVKEKLVPLIKRIGEAPEIDDSFLALDYPMALQRKFSDYLMEVLHISRDNCAIAETEHPFTINFNKYDVRITTHYHEDNMASSMYSVIHEGGHAIYELNTGDELYGSPLASGTSMGVHESQSRFFENIIGRSKPFVEFIYPKLLELFPEQLGNVTAEQFYRAVNKCQPSLIRTEADELTYPIHILIRYEIEKRMMQGEVSVDELPALWNGYYKEYLGVDVPDDKRGLLQDSHWSGGMFGYFPSYAIGSAYAAQFLATMRRDMDVFGLVSEGRIDAIVEYLAERIYKYGKLKTPAELIESFCGEPFDARYYIDYLTNKFTELYSL
ncbi:MAG: carboxypeptidase M32 [Clostridia bacterium]|nr:carboxypeptidase M32 [Clostridia bacterium]